MPSPYPLPFPRGTSQPPPLLRTNASCLGDGSPAFQSSYLRPLTSQLSFLPSPVLGSLPDWLPHSATLTLPCPPAVLQDSTWPLLALLHPPRDAETVPLFLIRLPAALDRTPSPNSETGAAMPPWDPSHRPPPLEQHRTSRAQLSHPAASGQGASGCSKVSALLRALHGPFMT